MRPCRRLLTYSLLVFRLRFVRLFRRLFRVRIRQIEGIELDLSRLVAGECSSLGGVLGLVVGEDTSLAVEPVVVQVIAGLVEEDTSLAVEPVVVQVFRVVVVGACQLVAVEPCQVVVAMAEREAVVVARLQ